MRLITVMSLGIASFAAIVTACSISDLFKSVGAACVTDSNCPDKQLCCSGKCVSSCGLQPLVVSARLATDFVPGYEFDQIIIDLDGEVRAVDVNVVAELTTPRFVGQFTEVRQGSHMMTTGLALAGNVVATRIITFTATADTTPLTTITRDCIGVSCKAPADQCVGGRCVSRSCSNFDTATCPSATCALDSDCVAGINCATAVCTDGACLQRRHDDVCAANQRCVPSTGCIARHQECTLELECDDLTSCTQDRCISGSCTGTPDDTRCGATTCDPTARESDPVTGCSVSCNQDNCTPGLCELATCVAGTCVRTRLCQGSEQCCNGVCALNCDDPRACAGRPVGYLCRAAIGTCDKPEYCDGENDRCPVDSVQDSTFVCRLKAGACDMAEICDGISGLCPTNVLVSEGITCRGQSTACDAAEACTGISSACPVDVFAVEGTVCRYVAGPCDIAETCSGTSTTCLEDTFRDSTTICRAATADPCDVQDMCPGNTAACPDGAAPAGKLCAAAPNVCYQNRYCTGTTSCPTNWTPSPYGTFYANIDFCSYSGCDGNFGAVTLPRNTGLSCDPGSCGACSAISCLDPCAPIGQKCVTVGIGAAGCAP